ncbi:MAG: 4-phosphoerythronate dehydrogenase [Luminiphilus sp.]
MRVAPDQLKWVIDDVIPHTAALKALMGDVTILPGRDITPATISNADIVLVRSITPVNESLLAGTSVQFVGTATAGVDHFDIEAIERLGVAWSAAPGSNAVSVVEYVLCALATAGWFERVLAGCPVGLVGLGQVGERLARRLSHLGCQVQAYDPLRVDWPGDIRRAEFEEILCQPVISLHANLHDQSAHASRGLLDAAGAEQMIAALSKREDRGLFINAGRGDLMTLEALTQLVDSPWTVILDTWPGEPSLSADLLSRCDWVSPHIAGHSIKARENGSDLLAGAVARWAGVEAPAPHELLDQDGLGITVEIPSAERGAADSEVTGWMAEFLRQQSILPREDGRLRDAAKAGLTSVEFDHLRKSYRQPAEWTGQRVTIAGGNDGLRAAAAQLGLKAASK